MEPLAEQQKKTLEEILKIKSNFKKDGEHRKTKTYLHTRLNRLECLWAQFNERDIEIQKLEKSNGDHPYFMNNFFADTEKQYEDIRELLEAKLMKVEENGKDKQTENEDRTTESENELENTTHDETDRLLRIQTELIKLLERLIQAVQAESDQTRSTIYYQHKLTTIQTYWSKIVSNHTDMVANPHTNYHEYIEKKIYEGIEDKYEDITILIQEKLNATKRSEDDIKLPNLILPVFDGDYQAWTSFRDIFVRLIHNNTRLGAAEKMQYLKTHLSKEAGSLLQHLTISDANYETAWQLLNDRFENKRKICSSLLNRLLSQPKIEGDSANEVRKLHDTTKKCLHALSNLGIETETWSPFVCHIIIQKLDNESHKLYEQSQEKPRELPTYEGLFHFLETRFQTLESLRDTKRKEATVPSIKYKIARGLESARFKSYHTTTTKKQKCPYCQQSHKLYQCQKFTGLSIHNRRQYVQQKKICSNCLTHKEDEDCRSRYSCSICQRQHHTLLHPAAEKVNASPTVHLSTGRSGPKIEESSSTHNGQHQQVILATALVNVHSLNGKSEILRALVDQGSQASFISEAAADLIGLPRFKVKAEVSGLGLTKAGIVRHKIIMELSPRFPSHFSISIEALVLPRLTRQLPDQKLSRGPNLRIWNNMMLADPTFDTPGPIDLILGADVFSNIVNEGMTKYNNGLYSQQTEFGWIVSGPVRSPKAKINIVTSMVANIDLEQTLKNFWEIENVEAAPTNLSDHTFCEQHYAETHIRNQDGSYTVRMPFKSNKDELGESRRRAVARLLQNEKRFLTDKKLEAGYKNFMQEYIKLKHMIPVKQSSEAGKGYYLPHQAIIKEHSSTTKLRVVFDASAKTTTGLSLNDTMYTGPKLQNDLTDIIIRWRKHRYVFSADIEKMYRQIKMHPADQNLLRILWRPSPQEPIQEYQLTTVTYGTAAAPYLALRTLHQLAHDEEGSHPWAAQVVKTDFYVDDLLTGADSLRESKMLQRELIHLLSLGGFKLRKWATNQQSLLEDLPEDFREKTLFEINDGEPIKTLGLHWSPASDTFHFRVNLRTAGSLVTKRTVLSDIARLFDPAGWLAPVIIRAKIFMQELWIETLDWDTPLPAKLSQKWDQFTTELPSVQDIKIPRWIKYTKNVQDIEIHAFCDASEKAFAAVIYTKILTDQGDSLITMIASKTKVAPAKRQTTLPRLELCAAELAAKLTARIKKTFEFQTVSTYAWTDSQITLAWIQGEDKKRDNFVAPRVVEIRKHIPPVSWHHIKSEDNPADCASRGLSPKQLKTHHLWWTGPKWLTASKEHWPINNQRCSEQIDQNQTVNCSVATSSTTSESNILLQRFSTLTRMLRVLTLCQRFKKTIRMQPGYLPGIIQPEELHQTLIRCIKIVQMECFAHEMASISSNKPLSRSSKLISLTPFIDEEGVLRVGGRLDHSQLSFNQKHTIILPRSHHFTSLVILDAHMTTLHGGNQATLTYLRQKYWIIDAKSAVRTVIHHCVTCCRYRANTTRQVMGNLPAQRVTPTKPFTNTGIDYAGPFHLRVSKGRGTKTYKGYIVVFICLATKAIHLEAVSDLTTEAFLASYKRFTARRGQCANIYSDCGTTFVGAKNEMEKHFHQAVQRSHQEATHELASRGTKWHLIPPASPHFGGLWEAGVKSTKYHLKRIAGEVSFTFEEFSTLLAQIEACLNSRPICPLSNDPDDLTVLTPGHFLIGRPLLSPPELVQPEQPKNCLTHWKLISKLQNDFWKVWSMEYLNRLQQRTKWQNREQNIKLGDIVLLKEDNLPPGRWSLGRIEQTHPGSDGLVRVATVKTAKNVVKRPITKICKLPFENNEMPAFDSTSRANNSPSLTTNTITVRPPSRKRTRTAIKIYPTNIPARPSIEELRHTSLSTQQPKRLKLGSVLTLLTCVLCACAQPVQQPLTAPVEIEPFEHNPGIYMENISPMYMINNVWTIVVYYNLSTYYQQLNGFEECLKNLTSLCDKTVTYKYYCKSTLMELQHKVIEMRHNNIILHKRNGNHALNTRKRRAPLEIIGTAQHMLFGVLDQQYADHIEGELEKLKANENYLLDLARNQTSITEVTTNVLRKTAEEIQSQFEVFNNHVTSNMETLRAGLRDADIAQTFTALTAYTSFIMNNYEKTQKELIELITDAHNGKISPFLLSPQQLRDQIKHIREHIPATLIIPGESKPDDLLHLYNLITVQSRVTESSIIFRIKLPLPDAQLFQVFQLYPVPTEHDGEYYYIEPSSEYLATDLHRNSYYPLTKSELAGCRKTQTLGYLCEQKHPVYTRQASLNRCEMDLLNHNKPTVSTCNIKKTHPSQYWIQLHHPNHWIFVVHKKTTINIVCRDQVIIKQLEKSGIIRLSNNCKVRHPTMSISAQNMYSNSQRSSFLPLTNISTLLADMTHNPPSTGQSIPLVHLDTKPLDGINFKHPPNTFPTWDHHHIHHYVSTYVIATVLLIMIGCYIFPYLRKRFTSKADHNRSYAVPEITPRPSTTLRHATLPTSAAPR